MISFLHSFHPKKAINPVSSPEESRIQGWSFVCFCHHLHFPSDLLMYEYFFCTMFVPLFYRVFIFTTFFGVVEIK